MLAGMFTDGGKTLRVKKSFFKKPAPAAPAAPVKAERGAVQLWEAVHFREIISAPLLHPPHPFGLFRG